jgi:hypothetical protein
VYAGGGVINASLWDALFNARGVASGTVSISALGVEIGIVWFSRLLVVRSPEALLLATRFVEVGRGC